MEGITAERVQQLSKAYAELALARSKLVKFSTGKRIMYEIDVLGLSTRVHMRSTILREALREEIKNREDIVKALGGVI